MRKETRDVMSAFIARKCCKRARTWTNGDAVYLHGNCIAWRDNDGSIMATLAGWDTVTTRDRINGLAIMLGRMTVRRVKGRTMCGGKEIGANERFVILPADEAAA